MSENFEQLLNLITEIRESKQLTTSHISQETKINKDYLDAIEVNQLDKLPLGYEKIFIKSYLKYLNIDTDENIKTMIEYFDGQVNTEPSQVTKNELVQIDISQFKTAIVWAPIILVIIFLVYIVYSNFEQKKVLPVKELTVEESLATVDTTTYDKPDTLLISIKSLSDVFVFVKIDTIQQFSRTMKKDQVWNIKALRELNIYANYAGRISVSLFNNDLGVIGGLNQRLNYLIVDETGIRRRGLSTIKLVGDSVQ